MISPTPKTLEEHVLSALQTGPMRMTDLILRIQKVRKGTTKQGVYVTIRNLKQQEAVVVHGKEASLNTRWLNEMGSFFDIARRAYVEGRRGEGFFADLADGEKISYSFKDAVQTDAFWWHALEILMKSSKTDEPVYLYNPHDWFLIARRASEIESFESIMKKGKRYLMSVAGTTPADKFIAKDFDGDRLQFHMVGRLLLPKPNQYVNVVDDYLIEVSIDAGVASRIERWYKKTTKVDAAAVAELQAIVSGGGKTKLTISRNRRKASRLKRLLGKYFYLPKDRPTNIDKKRRS